MANKAIGFLQKISSKIRYLLRRLFTWPGKELGKQQTIPDAETVPTGTGMAGAGLDNNDPYNQYNDHVSQLNDVLIKLGLHQRISASQQYMYEMGRRDGSLGVVLDHLKDIAKATAQEMFRHIYVVIKGSLASLQAKKETRKSIKDYDNLCHQRNQSYHDYVQYQYRFFPRSYSWWLGTLYALVAIALILADIPLALKLIQYGFNLGIVGKPEEGFDFLFQGNFWQIVAINWEVFTTAIGISLCTVYIKIYYDEFIGTPYANKAMTFARFIEENKLGGNMMDTAAMQKSIKWEYRTKRWWKTALALFTVAVIVILAFFRQETANAMGQIEFSGIGKAAFIAITVLFPIIGGICLSHALTNFQNRRRLKRAVDKCDQSMKTYLKAVEDYLTAEQNYEDLKAASDRLCDEDRMVGEYLGYLIAFYRRGFAIGSMQPDKYTKGEDFFKKIFEWRNIAVSKKINHHINQPN